MPSFGFRVRQGNPVCTAADTHMSRPSPTFLSSPTSTESMPHARAHITALLAFAETLFEESVSQDDYERAASREEHGDGDVSVFLAASLLAERRKAQPEITLIGRAA